MELKTPSRRVAALAAPLILAGGLWAASQWWEKGLAERIGESLISPGGCYRVEEFKPFWVMPSLFHPKPDPNEDRPPKWFQLWSYPGFYRLYDHRSGELIGESNIYDLEFVGGGMAWGGGSGKVSAGMITIGPNLPDCMGDRPTGLKSQK